MSWQDEANEIEARRRLARELGGKEAVERHQANRLYCIPAVWARILAADSGRFDLSSLRWLIGGGERTPEQRIREFSGMFPGARYIDAYGMTETVSGDTMMEAGSPAEFVEAFGADVLRYYFMREVGFGQDGDFSHRNLLNRYNVAGGLVGEMEDKARTRSRDGKSMRSMRLYEAVMRMDPNGDDSDELAGLDMGMAAPRGRRAVIAPAFDDHFGTESFGNETDEDLHRLRARHAKHEREQRKALPTQHVSVEFVQILH